MDELNLRYDVPRKIGQEWVNNDQILLLLDGLDEVKPEHRAACVEAINAFRSRMACSPWSSAAARPTTRPWPCHSGSRGPSSCSPCHLSSWTLT